MNKIASPGELQAELQRLLAYSQTAKPSREKLAAGLKALADRVASNEEPDIQARQAAYHVAASIVKDRNKDYFPPLKKAAKAYYDSLDKTAPESVRYKLATELVEELSVDKRSHEASIRVDEQHIRTFEAVAADHNRLAQVE